MPTHSLRAVSIVAAILLTVGIGAAQAQEELFISNAGNDSITVYARRANGNVAPLRILSGPATGLSTPSGLAVDTVNNELLVSNGSVASDLARIAFFARTANGDVAPLRIVSGTLTSLGLVPRGLSVDTANDEVVVVSEGDQSVSTYARTANGLPCIGPHRNYPHHLFVFGDASHSVTGAYLASRILLRRHFEEMDPADEVFGFHR